MPSWERNYKNFGGWSCTGQGMRWDSRVRDTTTPINIRIIELIALIISHFALFGRRQETPLSRDWDKRSRKSPFKLIFILNLIDGDEGKETNRRCALTLMFVRVRTSELKKFITLFNRFRYFTPFVAYLNDIIHENFFS